MSSSCVFCPPPPEHIFYTGDLVFGLWDAFPVSDGHALLVPRRHVETWFDATDDEQRELLQAIRIAREVIGSRHRPDGFNIGINVGAVAGQTIFHLHVHVIPRYRGDVEDPRGGVRYVIPNRANYQSSSHDFPSSIPRVPHDGSLVRGGDDPLLPHLLAHIDLAHQADIAVAFTLDSGILSIQGHLQDLLDRGGRIRFLTGDYLGVTDSQALLRLMDLRGNVELRVFETGERSFHPKAYIFHNRAGGGAAIVGSSNLSDTALRRGIEWNYRVITSRDRRGFNDVTAAFEALFQHPATVSMDHDWIEAYQQRRHPSRPIVAGVPEEAPESPPEPYDVQLEALAALERTREEGNRAGLVVLATGLGKTWLSAFDSNRERFRKVLFVAHREEILAQARRTYRRIRPDARLGAYTGQQKDMEADILFASVQTLSRTAHLRAFEPGVFDYIVIDEFHHAAARTYRKLIDYFDPKFLLGLTATPERTDGGDLLQLCQENLVYRCDLVEGIRRDLLCPFQYFGVPDTVNYEQIPWRSSRFDEEALTKAVATYVRAQNVLEQYRDKAGQRTLAFCCSTLHADFMKVFFSERGVRTAAVHSGEGSDPRAGSLDRLRDGDLDVIFSVDMFNEGLDLPAVDTVMMLRPTESRLLWLQQFGRGLRKAEGKRHLVVIDYIGNHRVFLVKPRALLEVLVGLGPGNEPLREVLEKVRNHEIVLPPGCSVVYDLEAVDVLDALIRPAGREPALKIFYEDFRERYGDRPMAAESYHEGYNPRSARAGYGSWPQFVRTMGDLSPTGRDLLARERIDAFLRVLETTPMNRSYNMLVLQAMLNTDALPGEIGIDKLVTEVIRLAQRSARLQEDINEPLDDARRVRRLLEENPIRVWTGGRGTGGVRYFAYENGVFRFKLDVPEKYRSSFQELVRELVDWRLAEYLGRSATVNSGRIVCKVSHSSGRPILFLPDRRAQPGIPEGWKDVNVGEERYRAHFVKVAVNVMRKEGAEENQLPDILRRWFGPDAGLPGTAHQVVFISEDDEYRMESLGKETASEDLQLWRSYDRREIPPLFGLEFNTGLWNQGYVFKDGRIFLLVTLGKERLSREFQYQDRFLSPDRFQWQSQNSTTQSSTTGQRLFRHQEMGVEVYLFVREDKIRGGRAAPFIYCGAVDFVRWEDERPITIEWKLKEPVPEWLRQRLGVSET